MTTVTLAEFAAVPGRMPQQLIEYWVHGKGALKVRWGTPGDFNRCVRNLRKYFPKNPEGLCNRLHTRALGVPPGQEHALVAGAAADECYADISAEARKRAAKKGEAMPDGSYPIRNTDDLKNAIQSIGRAKDPAAVKKHIIKRARALDAEDMIPEGWLKKGKAGLEDVEPELVPESLTADALDFDPAMDEVDDEELAMFPTKKMWRGRLAPIGVPTGDRRRFEQGGIGHRDLPLPLLYQLMTQDGHQMSVVVGRILGIDINDEEAYGYGDWLDTEHTPAAQDRMTSGIGGVSVDLDDLEYELRVPGTDQKWQAADQCSDETGECAVHEFVVTKGRIAAATLVAIPAFAEAQLEMYDGVDEEGILAAFDEMPLAVEDETSCGCGMSAAAIASHIHPVGLTAAVPAGAFTPPAAAFADPSFSGLSGLVLDDKRYPGYTAVYGHLGAWDVPHVGLPGQSLPHSRTGYAYFHVGEVYTAEGESLPVGKIVWGGKHPSMKLGMRAAAQHYDDTSRAVAVVRAGEDAYGVWVSGVLLPWVTDEVKLDLGISPLSGDWRPVAGQLEMIAALTVNTPGFPVVRARQEAGRVTALIASAGPMRLVDEPITTVRWDPVANSATLTTGTSTATGTVTINLSPEVLQPYVEERLRDRARRQAAARIQAEFAAALSAEQERVRALYAVFEGG